MAVGRGSIKRVINASNEAKREEEKAVRKENQNETSEEEKQNNQMSATAAEDLKGRTQLSAGRPYLEEVKLDCIKSVPASWIKKRTSDKDIRILMESIKKYGLLEPLLVCQTGDREYQLLSGYSRLKALEGLNCETTSVKVMDIADRSLAKEIYTELHKEERDNVHEKKFQVITSITSELPSYLL